MPAYRRVGHTVCLNAAGNSKSIKSIIHALEKGAVSKGNIPGRTVYEDRWTRVVLEDATNELVSLASFGKTKTKKQKGK